MKDRIVKFIESEKLSAAEFADKIGVQRSSVSHVLNGRNNPGFSFIQKILETYPRINSRWLIMGEGDMYLGNTVKHKESTSPNDLFSNNKPIFENNTEKYSNNKVEIQTSKNEPVQVSAKDQDVKKEVVRVLIFYSDQTFDDYRPAK